MHMKKKVLLLSSVLLILIIIVSIVFIINKSNTNGLVLENKEEAKEQITGSNWLSMMYETGPGTGEYSESKSSLWTESGYIFNENLSGCENGGELSWNDDLGAVTLHSNKSDSCYVYFDAYIIPVINSVTTSNIETDSITLTVSVTNGNNLVTTYYYSNNNGTSYVSSNSNTYTFNGLDIGTEYSLSVYVEDSEGYKSEIYNLSETTDDAVLLANYIKGLYTADGVNNLYYHDGQGSYTNANQEAQDNSYRYAGANPNNYVCFGSDASTCPSDNLYRIIGVFDNQIKLIKNTSYGIYDWSPIVTPLNSIFLNSFSDIYRDKISLKLWNLDSSTTLSYTVKSWYNYEIKNENESYKIGLMYVHDYGYAASPNYWNTGLDNYSTAANSNWLYIGIREGTIIQSCCCGFAAVEITSSGNVDDGGYWFCEQYSYNIRPVFYLTSDVQYSSGSGTISDPIRIVV